MHLFLPLVSSLLYVAAALFLKQAAARGVGPWRTGFVCNWATALLFLFLWPMGGELLPLSRIYEPAVVGLLFVAAQLFTFLALQKGEVSVATPVLGSKVILVAFFTTLLLSDPVRPALWIAAGCSCFGIAFLNRGGSSGRRHVLPTIGLAACAAAGYALFDVLIMKWSPAWGAGRFLPLSMLFGGLFSIGFVPLFRKPLAKSDRAGWKPLSLGALFISLQSLILVLTLSLFGDATAVNVVYSTRGLWSVLAVWWLGHWFANREREESGAALKWRLLGALLLCAAVALVFV